MNLCKFELLTLLKDWCKSDVWQFAIKTWNGVAAKTPSERCSITIQNQQNAHAQLDGTIERRLPRIFFDFRIELMLIIRICTFGPIFSTEFWKAADIVGPVVMKRWGNVFLDVFHILPSQPYKWTWKKHVQLAGHWYSVRLHQKYTALQKYATTKTTSTNVKQNFSGRQ